MDDGDDDGGGKEGRERRRNKEAEEKVCELTDALGRSPVISVAQSRDPASQSGVQRQGHHPRRCQSPLPLDLWT